jgi:DNA (cytosine-5)-methyltransferase 1
VAAYGGNRTSGPVEVATALQAHPGAQGRQDFASETFVTVAPTLDANYGRLQGHDNQHIDSGAGLFVTGPAIAFDCKASGRNGFGVGEIAPTMRAMGHANSHANAGGHQAVALPLGTRVDRGGSHREAEGNNLIVGPLRSNNRNNSNPASEAKMHVRTGSAVRRLTPRECERLQGFPDDYTAIEYRGKLAADGPRYKALGNSMAVPVMRHILSRIEIADRLMTTDQQGPFKNG